LEEKEARADVEDERLVGLERGILRRFFKNILIFSFSLPPSAERQTPHSAEGK
jgi:hypothetical protein